MSPLTPSIFRSQNVPFAGKVGYLRAKTGFSGHILEVWDSPPPPLPPYLGPSPKKSRFLFVSFPKEQLQSAISVLQGPAFNSS